MKENHNTNTPDWESISSETCTVGHSAAWIVLVSAAQSGDPLYDIRV